VVEVLGVSPGPGGRGRRKEDAKKHPRPRTSTVAGSSQGSRPTRPTWHRIGPIFSVVIFSPLVSVPDCPENVGVLTSHPVVGPAPGP
jgi:hypothetical protein